MQQHQRLMRPVGWWCVKTCSQWNFRLNNLLQSGSYLPLWAAQQLVKGSLGRWFGEKGTPSMRLPVHQQPPSLAAETKNRFDRTKTVLLCPRLGYLLDRVTAGSLIQGPSPWAVASCSRESSEERSFTKPPPVVAIKETLVLNRYVGDSPELSESQKEDTDLRVT